MTIKNWVLGRVQKTGGLFARSDLPRSEPAIAPGGKPAPAPGARPPESTVPAVEHLGFYAALVGAIRDELEHFVASHVRLHLAIADHDRFLLTSIHVSCVDSAEARKLLHQFMQEFKPEQVKRYLAREVIGALPNAAAIDLTQFAGLLDADAQSEGDGDSEYGELLAALRTATPAPTTRAYRVSIVGRWTERDSVARATASGLPGATPATPMTGKRCDFDVEDADGRRRVVLHGVTPGRRYLIGKDDGCDIRVNGTYTSRRHGELWLDQGGAWHLADAGSTNGIRVESAGGSIERSMPPAKGQPSPTIALSNGSRAVLSAHAEGPAADYPSLSLRSPFLDLSSRVTPIARVTTVATDAAQSSPAAPPTPLTPVHSARAPGLFITARGTAGPRTLELQTASLPVTVGRSRNQSIVIGRAHELVSGHHLDIVSLDDGCAQVLVHGDNGVIVEGVPFAPGSRFAWKPGQTMVLGAVPPDGRACTLTLSRRDD